MYLMNSKDGVLAAARILGIVLLAGVLFAACGDDDDDDASDALDSTATVELTAPLAEDGTQTEAATAADTGTEAEGDSTGTATESVDAGTATEDDEASSTATEAEGGEATATEADADGAATEGDEDSTASSTVADDDPTATESDEDSTATEEEDGTATEEEDGTATADDVEGTATEDGSDTAEIGDTIELDGFSITIDSVETFAGIPGVFEADAGNQLIAVTLTIENTDNADELSVLRALSAMHLEDGSGERYDVDLVATGILLLNQEGIAETQIGTGGEVTGKVGFQIPEDTDELLLVIDSDTGEGTEIDLSDEL